MENQADWRAQNSDNSKIKTCFSQNTHKQKRNHWKRNLTLTPGTILCVLQQERRRWPTRLSQTSPQCKGGQKSRSFWHRIQSVSFFLCLSFRAMGKLHHWSMWCENAGSLPWRTIGWTSGKSPGSACNTTLWHLDPIAGPQEDTLYHGSPELPVFIPAKHHNMRFSMNKVH